MSNNTPFIVDKNLGVNMTVEPEDLTQTNADGEAVIAPTQEEKYLFDARGWLLFPGVLSDDDIRDMREYALQVKHEPQSLPEHEQSYLAGPLQKLADHPIVVGFMNEFVAHPHLASPDGYGFRMEASGIRFRSTRTGEVGGFRPHNGNGLFRFAIDSHHYQCIPGKAYSGLTRVVWELAPVQKGKGGTLVVSGSHKAVYAAPESITTQTHPSGTPTNARLAPCSSSPKPSPTAPRPGQMKQPTASPSSTSTTPSAPNGATGIHTRTCSHPCRPNARACFETCAVQPIALAATDAITDQISRI